jgi:hypothetical protein
MASSIATIGQSFDKLRGSLSIKHRHEFSSTVLEDVWDEVQRIESVQRKRHSAQNLRRIEPFLRGLEKYSKVIEVLCNGTPYLPFVWVSSLAPPVNCVTLFAIIFEKNYLFPIYSRAMVIFKTWLQGVIEYDLSMAQTSTVESLAYVVGKESVFGLLLILYLTSSRPR